MVFRSIKTPSLSYVLKYSQLIGVNEGNSDYKSLINIKVTIMHHTAKVLTSLVWRMCQASMKLTFLLPYTKASTLHPP
jgi:hypothetical protein